MKVQRVEKYLDTPKNGMSQPCENFDIGGEGKHNLWGYSN